MLKSKADLGGVWTQNEKREEMEEQENKLKGSSGQGAGRKLLRILCALRGKKKKISK